MLGRVVMDTPQSMHGTAPLAVARETRLIQAHTVCPWDFAPEACQGTGRHYGQAIWLPAVSTNAPGFGDRVRLPCAEKRAR